MHRNFFNIDINQFKLSDLCKKNKLQSLKSHPAQKLTDRMLLHVTVSSIHLDSDGCMKANVCMSCMSNLKCDKTPSMSLTNGMWIRDVPLELKVLTLPEHVLVTHFFPAAYIVKVYLNKKGTHYWAVSGHHHGLRGNVLTYQLNTNQIAHLASGNVMPPSPAILAVTIGVTFVGPRNYPQKTMPGFLQVNWVHVCCALERLKENNHLYADITISEERLASLLENEVPVEITLLMKYSNDMKLLAEENEGYIPSDDVDESGRFACDTNLNVFTMLHSL